MDSDAMSVVVATIIALILVVLYIIARWRERGDNPHWSAEVYLYYNPLDPPLDIPGVVASFNAKVATPQQVEVYLAAGGDANGYGYTDGGASTAIGTLMSADTCPIVGAIPTGIGGLTITAWPGSVPPSPVGIWLYGAKPRRGQRGITSFNCTSWFQPA